MNHSDNHKTRPNQSLKGPAAKNTPAWKRPATPVVSQRPTSSRRKWGGKIKNLQPWHRQEAERYKSPVVSRKQKLKGPRAKNRRPGQ